jgi:hypothetical protein
VEKQVGPITVEATSDEEGIHLVVRYDVGLGEPWTGEAHFPPGLEEQAIMWLDVIESENDVEGLMREWSSTESYFSFMQLRDEVGV